MVYPWYDKTLENPISNSLQYQFSTTGAILSKEAVDISSFPFLINDPNDSLLTDFTQESRQIMYDNAEQHDMKPHLVTLEWEGTTAGDPFYFTTVDCAVSEVTLKNSYTWNESSNFGCPRIFKVSSNASQSINYSSEYSYETEMGTTVNIDLAYLIRPEDGITTPPKYIVDVYWFKPNEGQWWFLDSLNGIRRYFDRVVETAGIYNTCGFNDDTRAYPSIPARHDLWRRASANWVAELLVRGIIDEEDAQAMVYDLAYGLAREAYRLDRE